MHRRRCRASTAASPRGSGRSSETRTGRVSVPTLDEDGERSRLLLRRTRLLRRRSRRRRRVSDVLGVETSKARGARAPREVDVPRDVAGHAGELDGVEFRHRRAALPAESGTGPPLFPGRAGEAIRVGRRSSPRSARSPPSFTLGCRARVRHRARCRSLQTEVAVRARPSDREGLLTARAGPATLSRSLSGAGHARRHRRSFDPNRVRDRARAEASLTGTGRWRDSTRSSVPRGIRLCGPTAMPPGS